MTNNDHK